MHHKKHNDGYNQQHGDYLEKICKYDQIPVAMIGPGNTESAVHSPNEHIFIEDYILGIKMAAAVIDRFAREE